MAKIKAGTYRFNDVLTVPSADYGKGFSINFECEVALQGANYTLLCDAVSLEHIGEGPFYFEWASYEVVGIGAYVDQITVYSSDNGWNNYYGVAKLKTITIPKDTDVSDEFEPWFTANTKRLSTITYNGSTIATLNGGQTATIKCAGKKMESDVVVELAEQSGGSGTDANIVPLLVGGAGTYDANSPVLVTETFTGGGTPDAVVSAWGVTLPYFKAKKLIATKDILTLARNEELANKLFVTVDGSVIPICQMDLSGDESGLMASMEGAPVILWFIDVEGAGYSKEDGFEDNSVYILDVWNLLGVTGEATLTALGIPDKPADGFTPVEVAIPYTDELTIAPKYQSTQHFENVYVGELLVTSPPITSLTVTPSTQKQTFSYGKDNSGNQAAYSSVTVEAVDVSKLRLLCDIELETLPTKTDYAPDEWLDTSGGVILCHYTDGSVFRLYLSNRYVFGFPTAIEEGAGKHTLVVQYKETGITCRTTYDITVTDSDDTGGGDTGGDTGGDNDNTADYTISVGDYFGIAYEGNSPAVECPSCLEYQDDGGELVFTGVSVGSGTIKLIRSSEVFAEYTVEVTA